MLEQTAKLVKRMRTLPLFTHLAALLLPVIALGLQLCIEPLVPQTSYQLFLGAVVLSALLGGIADGVLTLAISAIGRFLFFPAPRVQFVFEHPAILVRLVLFVAIGASVAWLVGRLRVTQGQLSAALTSTVDAVVVTNAKNRVMFLNPVSEVLTGWSREEAAGRPLEEVVSLAHEAAGDGMTLVSKNGSTRPVEHSTAPIRTSRGKVQGSIVVFRDVSERRQFEEQLRQAQKMEALGRLASGVAHDFNNLLTVIGGHAELIAGAEEAPPQVRRSAETIRNAFEQATRLTRQLLVFGKRQAVQPRSLDLNKVLGNLEPTLRSLAGDRVQLLTNFESPLGKVHADTGQIEQVVVNLMVNARDAMAERGTITIRTRNAQLFTAPAGESATFRPGAYVALEVVDTGAGMDEKTRSKIFEPFFTTKPAGKGTGLGLAIVYGIVAQCGGHIRVASRPGHGSTFTILLPRADDFGADMEVPHQGTKSEPGKGVILFAEDDDKLRNLLVSVLKDTGYEVLPAGDGARALNIAAAELNRIDLVVTDIDMPVVSGSELMEYLWTLDPKMKVLYLSGHTELGDPVTRGRTNARFLAKPFSLSALLAEVAALIPNPSHEPSRR
jgi:two-component system cell cycle sensor histidine kinase/response regulator CckA